MVRNIDQQAGLFELHDVEARLLLRLLRPGRGLCLFQLGEADDLLRAGRQLARPGGATPTRATNCGVSTSEDNRIRASAGALLGEVRHQRQHELQLHGHSAVQRRPIWRSRWPAARTASRPSGPFRVFTPPTRSLRVGTTRRSARTCSAVTSRLAFFASVDFDMIPKVLTMTGGIRHYHYDEFEHGSEYYSATSSVLNVPNGTAAPKPGFGINLKKSESGNKQPCQPHVARHARCTRVLHVFARVSPGRLQSHLDQHRWQPSSLRKAWRQLTRAARTTSSI